MPAETLTTDIHCVTGWSKLDTKWRGVSLDVLLGAVEYEAKYVLAFCDGGYTTNMPVADLTGGRAWVAFGYGDRPLAPSTVARPGSWSRTCTSGRAPNGCAGCGCATPTSPVSGKTTATTCTETHGANSGTRATELADRYRWRGGGPDAYGPDAAA